jgi:apolipoprotein N-acyltransferase
VSEPVIQTTQVEAQAAGQIGPTLEPKAARSLSWNPALLWVAGAAAAFHLAYASPTLCWLMAAYLFCLVQLARMKTGRQAFYFGLAVGVLTVAPQLTCFWVIFGPAAIALWLVLAFWIALFVSIARLCLLNFPRASLLLIPLVWTGLEYSRSELYYLRFSWLNVGYAFSGSSVQGVLLWIGMYGTGFLLAAVATASLVSRTKVALGIGAGFLIGGIAFDLILGICTHAESSVAAANKIEVAGTQLEFPAPDEVVPALDKLVEVYPQAQLLALSEYTFDDVIPTKVKDWCRRHERYLVVGGKDPAPKSNFYDTAFVVGPNGDIIFRQVKSVPIQFFKDGLPATEQRLWESPWGKIGICVCYDLSYTRVTDHLIRMGAQALVVPTMDVIDWGLLQHELHARVAPIRAAEYGIPIFRMASSGISQLTDSAGRVVAKVDAPGQHRMIHGFMAIQNPGSVPPDRWLAPFSTCATVVLIVVLCVRMRQAGGRTE